MQTISTKERHFKQEIILTAVRWHAAYGLGYRDVEIISRENRTL